ncbi:RNA repair transcriptional activator RtcR family protein [Clostridium sp.]|uniref:RNA repair transcriptional activator RtcR family protein n=1 Tax=Clostridium sp. TaxID=1506 RepID=UPI00283C0F6B|nr:RNA repair transcriptional activator RtcR family protein [Clostridium sp.]MDR3598833.1 RNA repair transcriptional activator RtcR family protein [Clostridium sp.]
MKKIKNILLSFVGSNDAGKLNGKNDGAILTALTNQKFNEVILLWNQSGKTGTDYYTITNYLKSEIIKRKLAEKVNPCELIIKDVTDHNQIYWVLKEFADKLTRDQNTQYIASISSGTPAMQVCWILLAESGDFSEQYPLHLIKIKDPKFGNSENIEVKLDITLPKILRLKSELNSLKKDLLPKAILKIKRGTLFIGEIQVDLSPIEFCHYRYFAERVIDEQGDEKFSGISIPIKFMQTIYSFHEDSFPDLDLNRLSLHKMIKDGFEMGIQTFRGNISKINKKIKENIANQSMIDNFQISIVGKRGAKFYGIKAEPSKIKIFN